jgi:hypothetical protein
LFATGICDPHKRIFENALEGSSGGGETDPEVDSTSFETDLDIKNLPRGNWKQLLEFKKNSPQFF